MFGFFGLGRKMRAAIAAVIGLNSPFGPPGAPEWGGLRRKSVAMQNHAGACKAPRYRQGERECARRRRQTESGWHWGWDARWQKERSA